MSGKHGTTNPEVFSYLQADDMKWHSVCFSRICACVCALARYVLKKSAVETFAFS